MNIHTNITNLRLIGGSSKIVIPQGYNNDSSSSSLDFQIQNINKYIIKSGLKDNLTKQSSKIKILEIFYLYLQQVNRMTTKNSSFSPIKKKNNDNKNTKNFNNNIDKKSIPNLELDQIYHKKYSIIDDENSNQKKENLKQESNNTRESFISRKSKKQNRPIINLKTLNIKNDLNNSKKNINIKDNTKHLLMSPNQSKSKFCLNLSSQSPIQISDEFHDDDLECDQNINNKIHENDEKISTKSSFKRDKMKSVNDKKLDKRDSNTDQENIKYKDFSPVRNNLSTNINNSDQKDKIVSFEQNEKNNNNIDNLQQNKKNNPSNINKNPTIKRLSTIKKDSTNHYQDDLNDNFDLDNTFSTDQNIEEMNQNYKTILDKNDGIMKICDKTLESQSDYKNLKSNSKSDIETNQVKLYTRSVDNYIDKGKNLKELQLEFNEDLSSKTMRSEQFSSSLHNKINLLKNKFGSVYSSVSKTERTPKNQSYSKSLINNPKGKKLEFNPQLNQNSLDIADHLHSYEIDLKHSHKLTDAAEQLNYYNEMLALQEMRKKESMLRFQIYENDSTEMSKSVNNINNIKIDNKNSKNQNMQKKLSNQKSNDIKSNDITNKSITSEAYRDNINSIKEVFDDYGKGIMKEPNASDSVENINQSRNQSFKKESNQNLNNQSNLNEQNTVDVIENKTQNFELMDENEKNNHDDDDYMTFNEQNQVEEKDDNEYFNKRKTLKEKLLKKDSNKEDNKNSNIINSKKSRLDQKQNKNDNLKNDVNTELVDLNFDLKLIKRYDSYDINNTLNKKDLQQQSQSFKDSFDNNKKIKTDRSNQSLINQKSQVHTFIKEYKNKIFSPLKQKSGADFNEDNIAKDQDELAENILENQININLDNNNLKDINNSKISNSINREFSPISTDSKTIELNSEDSKLKSKINLKDDFLSNNNNSKTQNQNTKTTTKCEKIKNDDENNDKVFNQIFGNSDKKPSKNENYCENTKSKFDLPESPKQNILIAHNNEIKPKNLNTQLNLNINLSNFDKNKSPAKIEIQRNNLEVINIEFSGDKQNNEKSKFNINSENNPNQSLKLTKYDNDSNQIQEIETGCKKDKGLLSNNPNFKNNGLFNNPRVTMINNNMDNISQNLQNSQESKDSKDSDNTINSSHQNDSLLNSKIKNTDSKIENTYNQTQCKSKNITINNNDSLLNSKIKNTYSTIEKPIKHTLNKKSQKNKSPNIIIDSNINIFDNISKCNNQEKTDDKINDKFSDKNINLNDSFDINSLNNLNSYVLSSEKAIQLKLLIQELKSKFKINNSCYEDIQNYSKQTLQIICDYVQNSLSMYENLTKKYQDSGKIISNNKIILFHYLKQMYKQNDDLLNNRSMINQSKSDSIKSIYSKHKKEIDEIDFSDLHFEEKLSSEELIASIDMHSDIVHNNEINIGLLKTRIKHMWDQVGCCNECMLTIDKLCCQLDVKSGEGKQSEGGVKIKINDEDKLSNQDIKCLLNDLDGKINQLDNLKI